MSANQYVTTLPLTKNKQSIINDLATFGKYGNVIKNNLADIVKDSEVVGELGIHNAILIDYCSAKGIYLPEIFTSMTGQPIFNGLTTITDVANSSIAMDAIANSSTAMDAIANSSTAMDAVINSSIAMDAIANSSIAMDAIANSSIAIDAIANSSIAMDAIANSSIAMDAIANSSIAMDAIINSGNALYYITINNNSGLGLEKLANSIEGTTTTAWETDTKWDTIYNTLSSATSLFSKTYKVDTVNVASFDYRGNVITLIESAHSVGFDLEITANYSGCYSHLRARNWSTGKHIEWGGHYSWHETQAVSTCVVKHYLFEPII